MSQDLSQDLHELLNTLTSSIPFCQKKCPKRSFKRAIVLTRLIIPKRQTLRLLFEQENTGPSLDNIFFKTQLVSSYLRPFACPWPLLTLSLISRNTSPTCSNAVK